jgi:hypothetical protein
MSKGPRLHLRVLQFATRWNVCSLSCDRAGLPGMTRDR